MTKGGVSTSQKQKIVKDITDSLVETLGKKPEHIHIVIDEVEPENREMLLISSAWCPKTHHFMSIPLKAPTT